MRKIINVICAFCVTFCLFSCKNAEIVSTELDDNNKRIWTTIIYMAADNNLEGAAIQDFNELESVSLNGSGMTVLVLLDRAEGEDGTNGDWTDTRLFEVKKDSGGKNGTIVSKRLECPELNLFTDCETELNMGEPSTLSGLIDFAKRKYPAEHYALVMWGHGSGWRGMCGGDVTCDLNLSGSENENYRAFANDKKTNTFMSVQKFGNAVKGKGLDVIAFDTCFAALIEIFYEVKDAASVFVGSAGVVPAEGFDYCRFLTDYKKSGKTPDDFASCIANSSGKTVSFVKADAVSAIACGVNKLSALVADTINTKEERDEVYDLFLRKLISYDENSYPSDYFIDVYDFANFYSRSRIGEISAKATELKNQIASAIKTTNTDAPQLGIYFGELLSKQSLSPSYPEHYINGKNTDDKSSFVIEMTGWVPTEKGNVSLLDKLFNVAF